jgi:hypothetical protein
VRPDVDGPAHTQRAVPGVRRVDECDLGRESIGARRHRDRKPIRRVALEEVRLHLCTGICRTDGERARIDGFPALDLDGARGSRERELLPDQQEHQNSNGKIPHWIKLRGGVGAQSLGVGDDQRYGLARGAARASDGGPDRVSVCGAFFGLIRTRVARERAASITGARKPDGPARSLAAPTGLGMAASDGELESEPAGLATSSRLRLASTTVASRARPRVRCVARRPLRLLISMVAPFVPVGFVESEASAGVRMRLVPKTQPGFSTRRICALWIATHR